MKSDVSIVYLWAEVTGYVHGVLKVLSRNVTSVDVVHWDKKGTNSTHYRSYDDVNLRFHGRSSTDERKMYQLLVAQRPSIIVVSGWMDDGYIRVCKRYKHHNKNVKIVAGIDDQWIGTLRQRLGKYYYAIFYRNLFDFMWVSGAPQFSFAQRFGYGMESILLNLYSAETELFRDRASLCRRFLYVGRFVKIKAPDLLLAAYQKLPHEVQKEWPLVYIGDGELRQHLSSSNNPNVLILPFMTPHELRNELLNGGIACVPSHKDQWGVAVHECALMGLPLLLSSGVGASTEFLINGYNGYLFNRSDVDSLLSGLLAFTKLSDEELSDFSVNSQTLGMRISSEISAYSLLGVINFIDV